MSNTPHSQRCHDLTTFWDPAQRKCIPCSNTPIKPGHEITPNCGRDDDGGRHEPTIKPCKTNTFNNGSSFHCKPCSTCQRRFQTERPCNTTADTVCGKVPVTQRIPTTDFPVTKLPTSAISSGSTTLAYQGPNLTPTPPPSRPHNVSGAAWAVPLAILISIVLAALSAYVFGLKRKRAKAFCRQPSYINDGFAPLTGSSNGSDVEDILCADILSAPLQTVLDNLDVLEELVILLDPESHVRKSTKHLASHCAFPSTWITYTYSMKDSKSPLKAVLEGVTCKNPDWTVGHLAKLLKHMERNDAIAALAKLKTNKTEV
ncbi:IGF-like family receptor 1 isoform X2 [Neolamprologus brichardi]|uniref:IGF-like family receptor 1 isoform X2 n=1 Tax=Neolamprologus brichardi TaxID=32507 RepID=UPI0003EC4134|nr:IGF-like family receptor 1 isoform X2 [Neolamprologus brichardi]